MTTIDQFRHVALSMPEAVESSHMGHPDFRAGAEPTANANAKSGARAGGRGKIFATLFGQEKGLGMIKLRPEQQRRLIKAHPDCFQPIAGGWGRQGATQVKLDAIDAGTLRSAMMLAWRNAAPKRLLDETIFSNTSAKPTRRKVAAKHKRPD